MAKQLSLENARGSEKRRAAGKKAAATKKAKKIIECLDRIETAVADLRKELAS